MKIRDYISTITVFTFILFSNVSFAVERAPRISDREIIESLAELKAGQKSIKERFEQVDKRFEQIIDQMDKRFEQMDKRFELMADQMNKRFEQLDKRLDDSIATNRMFFGFIISILLALFGYIIWDRRTLMKPLDEKIHKIERELEMDFSDGTRVSRLINALRKLSEEDEKVANVMRQFHLL